MRVLSAAKSSGLLKRFLFETNSFAENLVRLLMELLPQPMRYWIFKALFARLGEGSMFDNRTYFRCPWKISVAIGVSINRGGEFYGSVLDGKAHITIGDHCALAPRVHVLSATHDYGYLHLPDRSASVTIGQPVWIGAGATLLPGINIGDGAAVAVGSVVTRDVDPFTIVAGNPARVIKNRELNDASAI